MRVSQSTESLEDDPYENKKESGIYIIPGILFSQGLPAKVQGPFIHQDQGSEPGKENRCGMGNIVEAEKSYSLPIYRLGSMVAYRTNNAM